MGGGHRRRTGELHPSQPGGDLDALVELFTADGAFVVHGEIVTGRDTLRVWFQGSQGRADQRGKHLTLNPLISVHDDRADVVSDFIWLRHETAGFVIARAGRYLDEMARDGDGWKFARREVTFMPQAASA